jgi:hypothetical protein
VEPHLEEIVEAQKALLGDLQAKEQRVQAEWDALREKYRISLAEIRDQRMAIEKSINLLTTGVATSPRPKRRSRTPVSDEVVDRVEAALPRERFTVPQLMNGGHLEVNESSVRAALDVLRERGIVRRAGKEPAKSTGGSRAEMYAVIEEA